MPFLIHFFLFRRDAVCLAAVLLAPVDVQQCTWRFAKTVLLQIAALAVFARFSGSAGNASVPFAGLEPDLLSS